MRQLIIAIAAGACLGLTAADEGRDLKSLVRPQTLSCELRDIRLTRTIDKIGTATEGGTVKTKGEGGKSTDDGGTKTVKGTSSNDEKKSSTIFDTRLGGRFNAEGGAKFGFKPAYGSIGGNITFEGVRERHNEIVRTDSSNSGTQQTSTHTSQRFSSYEQEQTIKDSYTFHLGQYRLEFSVILENRNARTDDALTVDCSKMQPELRGPGLTGGIRAPCIEQERRTLDVGTNSFGFVYKINDKKRFDELIHLGKNGQLDQLSMSKTGADIPVMSSKSVENVLSKQLLAEQRNPGTTVLVELERFRRLPFWRVSRQHTAESGHQGDFVTLREALQGIELSALDFSDSLPKQMFVFSEDGSLVEVRGNAVNGDAVIKKDEHGNYHVLALRLKNDKTGKTSLELPLADKLSRSISYYSEIAIISFTFNEFVEWAVQFPSHFAALRKEIENWLAYGIDNKEALSEFRKQLEERQHIEDIKPLYEYDHITKDDVDRFRERAKAGVPEMQFKFARCLSEGWSVAKNEAEAVKWYREAAKQGNADSQYYLGCCYMHGIGVVKKEMEAVKWYRMAAEQGNADAIAITNLQAKVADGKIEDAVKILSPKIKAKMSRIDIDGMIFWIEKLVTKLRGGDTSLRVKIFTPPDPKSAYKWVKKNQDKLPKVLINAVTGWFVDWERDAQRVVVAEEYLNQTTLLDAGAVQKELARFDELEKLVDAFNSVVVFRRKSPSEDRNPYIAVEKNISLIKKRLETNRTHFLSYEVVSPYLYEAHCHLFVGFSEGWQLSSFDKAYGNDKVKEYRTRGFTLLNMISDHPKWRDLCTQDVREQFDEINDKYKEKE